ncbi:MAG: DNA (cytosine-5-)-methyltransferase [Alphaproteobacteria bacterium]
MGGFSLGLERTGRFRTIAFCEIDVFCQRVLRKHWPDVAIHGDVRTIDFRQIPADVVTGGFPCQDISNAGYCTGIEGTRSGLWSEIVRAIRDIRPRFVVVENVAALTYRGLGRVLGDLAECGYDCQWHCIPASALGAVHHRDRIWIIAYPREIGRVVHDAIYDSLAAQLHLAGLPEQALAILSHRGELRFDDTYPDVRTHDGFSSAMDRIGACGNAIYPEIATIIGRAIAAADDLLIS